MKEEYRRILDKIANEEELSTEEQQFIDDFYSSFERRPDVLADMERNDQRQIKRLLKQSIDRRIDQAEKPHKERKMSGRSFLKIASVLVIFVSVSMYLYNQTIVFEKSSAKKPFEIGSTYSSDTSVTQVRLPDGSLVFLNANSSLDVDQAFGNEERRVSVKGEAYFDIAERENVPFVVYINDGVVRVLGTAFWLNDRDFSNYLTLVSGKVQFEDQAQTILMQPNQRLSKVAGESQFEVKQANLRLLQTWKTNPFLLHNITMEDFADFLMNRYSVDILFINEDIKGCSITISIDGSETYQQLLTMAGMVNDFDFTEENGQIKVSGAGCSSLKNVRD